MADAGRTHGRVNGPANEGDALNSRVGAVTKSVGILTALISFGTALYALIHSASELRDHKRIFQEQLKSGQAQEAAGDFAGGWDSFTHAEATVADEGDFAKQNKAATADPGTPAIQKTLEAGKTNLAQATPNIAFNPNPEATNTAPQSPPAAAAPAARPSPPPLSTIPGAAATS